ncbi:POT family proton-dependent oligopeptide transporter [Dyadobacter jejuensis]|uniref:POT family proton-dependent oligopeptide transporter n=1 Tax=Dyadobacter jejuensis TaxID=1082580 RepID=A0A316AJ67_9BACT|nr:peptide MFS transporter [Dyadobacter jejuensis]PWJ57736.1 POT family proton-dependent oligopeptide transporter [Dyadobacter jejuensis]
MSASVSAKHPRGLYVLFFAEMWERFSYYGMRAILLLFLIDNINGGMGLDAVEGAAVYGLYTASVYLLTLPGGWMADNILGQKKAIWYGGIIIMLGHIILAIPAGSGIFFLGLVTVALGTGLLKPNISSIVGELYPEGGARRDAAFSIFYMGINLGSVLGITIVGYLGQKVNWHMGFGAAAIGMLLGLVVFKFGSAKYLSGYGEVPAKKVITAESEAKSGADRKKGYLLAAALVVFLAVLQLTGTIDMSTAQGLAQGAGVIIVTVSLFYFLFILFAGGLTAIEKKRVLVLIVFFIAAALFWSGFEQAGSSLQIFAERHTQRTIGTWEMPSSWFQNFNGAFILLFAPVMASLWIYLSTRGLNPSTPVKFALGLLLLGGGFFIMELAASQAVTGQLVSPMFLTLTYLFHTIGELCLSPVGLSSYTKLAPKRYLSQLMGIWFVAASLGNLIAGLFAGNFDENNVDQMPALFNQVALFSVGFGLLLLIFYKPVKNWMGGIK